MGADGPANTKVHERTEGAATAVQAIHGDSCPFPANRVFPDPMRSASFGDDCTGPPAPPCSGQNALVDSGAAAPKSCLPPLEMRSSTAAGGLLPTGEASIVTRTTFNHPPLRLYSTEDTNSEKTSTQDVSYDSNFWRSYLLTVPSCRYRDKIKIRCSILVVLRYIVYTEQGKNRGIVILHGARVCYSAYTLR